MSTKVKFLLGILAFSIFYLFFSLATYKDYGITADEDLEYNAGKALANYYQTGKNPSNTRLEERHLPTNSIYFRVYPALLDNLNFKGYFEWFHLLNLVFSLTLFLVFYSIVFYETKNPYISFLGSLTLFLTPRILGDIPANPKDIPFATLFFLSLSLIYLFSKKKIRLKYQIPILGLIFGITWGLRVVGLSIFVAYFLISIITLEKKSLSGAFFVARNTLIIFGISLIPLLINWPYFRLNFPQSLVALTLNGKSFENWDNTILFMGDFLTKSQRPASYLPVWFLITSPLYILVPFALSGLSYFIKRRTVFLLSFIALGVNIILYFSLNPVVYNGPRHFDYLLPIVTLVSFFSFIDIAEWAKKSSKILAAFFITIWFFGLVMTARIMTLLHPYEYVYFNELVGGLKGAQGKFEMDYWNASNKEAAEWLVSNINKEDLYYVYSCDVPFSVRYYSSSKYDLVDKSSKSDYVVCDYETAVQRSLKYPIIHTVSRMGADLNYVMQVNAD